jgi:hypothetical protein
MYQLPSISNDLTKGQIRIIAESVVNELCDSGRVLEAAETLTKMETLCKEIRGNREFIDFVRDEIEKHGKELTTANGVKLELAEVGTKYDYSQCNDDVLSELEFQLTIIEAKIKERQNFLKTLPVRGMEIIKDGGEVALIFPPSKSSTSSYKTTIKK